MSATFIAFESEMEISTILSLLAQSLVLSGSSERGCSLYFKFAESGWPGAADLNLQLALLSEIYLESVRSCLGSRIGSLGCYTVR